MKSWLEISFHGKCGWNMFLPTATLAYPTYLTISSSGGQYVFTTGIWDARTSLFQPTWHFTYPTDPSLWDTTEIDDIDTYSKTVISNNCSRVYGRRIDEMASNMIKKNAVTLSPCPVSEYSSDGYQNDTWSRSVNLPRWETDGVP